MRMMAKISIPVDAGNRAIADGTIGKVMQNVAEQWRPEAMYFTAHDGQRTAYIIFDQADTTDIPSFAEPLFAGLGADINLTPVMNAEDLQRGLARLS